MDILVVLEDNRGSLHRMGKEAIAGAQKMGGSISALAIGVNADAMAGELSDVDITEVITINHDFVSSYNADGYSDVVSQVIKSESPKTIVAGHSYQTRDFMPRVSAKLDIPFIPDIISMDDGIVKQVLNAKLNALVTTSADQVILSFQSATFSEEAMVTGSCLTRSIEVNLDSSIVRSEAEEPFQEDAGDVDLESAELIVSIGRGIEKEENIQIAFDLAKALGAEVSASRPVVDSGWVEPFRQIGSSGQNVSPKLYFSLGISGAIQHVVGMKGSKNIIAINKDPDAPIFEIADYAVVGDVLEIVPKLIEALNN
ncbi:MAG: electron transfer flavoprotein subunit alpha/FixB family protein [Candidatus Marinimicrobia bacterium]|nr:electron transfer flavoprotein subunit alpha/FixB family protein [Candidatus Neomarinimicrobiota bacterium]MBT4054929.1 electron transfer flavoprotein subunit alpha/FixB family protein [Candidatus Neomarinimicrobiota bacterium]MBT4369138.1 electron transfer flavoprotein subunit alpha/FixB family protein [Candidatus Neomarinimicrobiota bacterium]MBT4828744.1 electron transfer flavoprotein subunit alpha/FixB family protein [Candidatus Neomarinimicrobiota bacterium]MBT6517122.1 electron transfe